MLTSKKTELSDEKNAPESLKAGQIVSWIGLILLIILTCAWLLTFPTAPLLIASLSGSRAIAPAEREIAGIAGFFRRYPQVIWLGFAFAAGLFFWFRPNRILTTTSHKGIQATQNPQSNNSLKPKDTGQSQQHRSSFPPFTDAYTVSLLWRGLGIVALLVILVVAAIFRIGDARNIGATDLVAMDYDESVYASTAALITQGKALYGDFFSSQPPLGFWLWSLPLRFGGAQWGGLDDFLRMRLFTSLLSLVTIALVYLIGRKLGGKWGGPIAGSIAAFALAVDGNAVRIDQQVMLEPLVNFFSALAILTMYGLPTMKVRPRFAIDDYRVSTSNPQFLALSPNSFLFSGLFVGMALSVKFSALALLAGLGLTLLIWRRWKEFGFFLGGTAASFLLINGYALLTNGGEYIKQTLLYQFLRPSYRLAILGEFRSESAQTALEYLYNTPYIAFTLLAAGLGLVAIVLRWAVSAPLPGGQPVEGRVEFNNSYYFGRGGEQWLPVVLVASFTVFLYVAKAGFFPHYYDQMALPLALLAGGVVNFWRVEWWRGRVGAALSAVGVLALALVLWPAIIKAGDEPSKPVWSWERAADRIFDNQNLARTSVFTLDTRFSFIMGLPMPPDAYGKYWVENSGYTEYLGLGMHQQNLGEAFRTALLDKKPDKEAIRQLRYSAAVQNNLVQTARKADYFIWEAAVASQVTAESQQVFGREFISRDLNTRFEILANSQKTIRYPSGALFGGQMRLTGFNTSSEFKVGSNDNKLPLTLFWVGEQRMSQDYFIFVHLLNDKGEKVAQRDTAPRYGSFNTTKWEAGKLLDDDQSLPVPPDLPPGKYKILIGVYRPDNFERLDVTEAPTSQPTPDGNSLVLLEIEVR